MYALDLSSVSIDGFERAILSVTLIPSRRRLRDHISDVVKVLHARDVRDLDALRRLLRDKRRYPQLAPELGVDEDYLTLLAREVGSYVTKPLPLARLERLSEAQLARLGALDITSTRDLYERAARRSDRARLAQDADITSAQLDELLELSDLVRITGVGPASARALREIGVSGPVAYLATDSGTIQSRYADWTEAHTQRREILGLADIDYCRRYCEGLTDDIER